MRRDRRVTLVVLFKSTATGRRAFVRCSFFDKAVLVLHVVFLETSIMRTWIVVVVAFTRATTGAT